MDKRRGRSLMRLGVVLMAAALLGSCAAVHYEVPAGESASVGCEHWERALELTRILSGLDTTVNPQEATLVARTAVLYSLELANEYELTRPPIVHNTLVNLGFKERGLCIHWAEDLIGRLRSLKPQTLQFHWGVANRRATFRIEHSTVVVTARGRPFEEGVVLDPWRDSGRLYFGPVSTDKYAWEKW